MILSKIIKPYKIFSPKKRLGSLHDGGYVTPELLLKECSALFSYGCGGNLDYENSFISQYGKDAYTFDHTMGWGNFDRGKWHFREEGLGIHENNCRDFIDHHKQLKIQGNVLLKIDIEGAEYNYFSKVDIANLASITVGIILEIHDIGNRLDEFTKVISKINECFLLCHIHGNVWGGTWKYFGYDVPTVLELTFVNKKLVSSYELDDVNYPIHGLDQSNKPGVNDCELDFLNFNKLI